MDPSWHPNFSLYSVSDLCPKFEHYNMIKSVSRTTPSSSVTCRIYWGFLTRDMEDMRHPWVYNCSWHWNINLCVNFQHSSMILSMSRTPLSSSGTWRTLRVPDPETRRTWLIFDFVIVLDMGFSICLPNLTIITWLEVRQEPPHHHQWLGGYWGFLTRDMEDMSHPWLWHCSWHWNLNLCAKFQHSSMILSMSRTLLSSSGTWRTLTVPEQRHEGYGSFLTSNFFLIFNSWPVSQISTL